MWRRGELLAIVEEAPGGLRTLEGAVTTRVWRDGVETVTTSYVVAALPDRWRIIQRGHVAVCDGERSWAGTATLVTERTAERSALRDMGAVGTCLYPGRLLGWLAVGDPVEAELAGRACWIVDARTRSRLDGADPDHAVRPTPAGDRMAMHQPAELAGHEHRLWFDAETGVMLRHEGTLDGERCSMTELTDLHIDRPVPHDEFVPPPDAIVRSRYELLRDHLVSVGIDPDSLDLDDPTAVRDALRAGLALDGPPAPKGGRDDQAPVASRPADPDAARERIRDAVENLTEVDARGNLPNVHGGHGLGAVYEQARRRVPGQPDSISLVVDDCLFLAADRAVVWYSVLLDGRRPPAVRAQEGRVVRVGDRWLVERATFADLVGLAGVVCPTPTEA